MCCCDNRGWWARQWLRRRDPRWLVVTAVGVLCHALALVCFFSPEWTVVSAGRYRLHLGVWGYCLHHPDRHDCPSFLHATAWGAQSGDIRRFQVTQGVFMLTCYFSGLALLLAGDSTPQRSRSRRLCIDILTAIFTLANTLCLTGCILYQAVLTNPLWSEIEVREAGVLDLDQRHHGDSEVGYALALSYVALTLSTASCWAVVGGPWLCRGLLSLCRRCGRKAAHRHRVKRHRQLAARARVSGVKVTTSRSDHALRPRPGPGPASLRVPPARPRRCRSSEEVWAHDRIGDPRSANRYLYDSYSYSFTDSCSTNGGLDVSHSADAIDGSPGAGTVHARSSSKRLPDTGSAVWEDEELESRDRSVRSRDRRGPASLRQPEPAGEKRRGRGNIKAMDRGAREALKSIGVRMPGLSGGQRRQASSRDDETSRHKGLSQDSSQGQDGGRSDSGHLALPQTLKRTLAGWGKPKGPIPLIMVAQMKPEEYEETTAASGSRVPAVSERLPPRPATAPRSVGYRVHNKKAAKRWWKKLAKSKK